MKENCNKMILEVLGTRPIAFNPMLAKISGNATSGLFLSQLLFWWGKGNKEGWIYKTIKEFQDETCLIRSEQDSAIRNWRKLGVLTLKHMEDPQTKRIVRHFKVNIESLIKLLRTDRGRC